MQLLRFYATSSIKIKHRKHDLRTYRTAKQIIKLSVPICLFLNRQAHTPATPSHTSHTKPTKKENTPKNKECSVGFYHKGSAVI